MKMMDGDQQYQRWIEHRQSAEVPDGFSDRLMKSIQGQQTNEIRQQLLARLVLSLVASRPGKLTACCAALVLGMTPFLYLILAQLIGVRSVSGLTLWS